MRCITLLVACLLLSACDISQRLALRPTATGDRFSALPADASTSWPDPSWWEGFGSAELDRLIVSARQNNRDLQAAAQRVAQAEAQTRISRAALFPSVDADGSVNRGRSTTLVNRTRTSYNAGLSASYELDLAGELRDRANASDVRLLSSVFDRDAVALTLTADTANAYFTLLALRDRLVLARDTLQAAQRVLRIVRVQARAGQSSDLEIQQQLSAVRSQEASVVGLASDERQQVNELAVLLGLLPEAIAVQVRTLDRLSLPPIEAGLPSELLRRRPDLARAEADLAGAGFDAQATRAARFPVVALTASAGLQSSALHRLTTLDGALWSLAGAVTAPVFDAGRLQANEDQAVARYQELAANYSQAILSALRDVENALIAARYAEQAYLLRRQAYVAAREAYRIAELRWRTGATDFLSVLNAQQTSFTAADTLAQADLARFTASVSLFRALGGGWQQATVVPSPAS